MRQFYVQGIYVTNAPAASLPKGAILALDKDGEWYQYIGPGVHNTAEQLANWPKPTKRGIQLYRDYWRIVMGLAPSYYARRKLTISPNDHAVVTVAKTLVAGR